MNWSDDRRKRGRKTKKKTNTDLNDIHLENIDEKENYKQIIIDYFWAADEKGKLS